MYNLHVLRRVPIAYLRLWYQCKPSDIIVFFSRQEELDLTAANRSAMLELPLEKKWQLYCSRKKKVRAMEKNAQLANICVPGGAGARNTRPWAAATGDSFAGYLSTLSGNYMADALPTVEPP